MIGVTTSSSLGDDSQVNYVSPAPLVITFDNETKAILNGLIRVLNDVAEALQDFQDMVDSLEALANE
jgi:hypothetical protein